jgi:transposase
MSDHKGAALLADKLPPAKRLLADRGYDSDHFRRWLRERGIKPCIPPRRCRKVRRRYDRALYKKRHVVENMFAKLKDWRRIAMRYDRCAHTFFSAICIAAAVIFYLKQ